jgi:hypothetical protein
MVKIPLKDLTMIAFMSSGSKVVVQALKCSVSIREGDVFLFLKATSRVLSVNLILSYHHLF